MGGSWVVYPKDTGTGFVFVSQASVDQERFGGFGERLDYLVEIERGVGSGLDQFLPGA